MAKLNKTRVTRTDIPFDDPASAFPIVLADEKAGIKATIDWDGERADYRLNIDGEPYESLVDIDPSSDPKIKFFKGKLYINDI